MPVYVNFIFPEGCSEFYQEAQMSSVPRVGEYIQGSRPESGRYRVVEVLIKMTLPLLMTG